MSLGREILIIKIKITNTLADTITIRERDEPSLVSQKFCKKHKLPDRAVKAITYIIDKNIDELIEEQIAEQINKTGPSDLYSKGLVQKAKTQEKLKKIQKSLDLEISKTLTFKPSICQQSIDLLKYTPKSKKNLASNRPDYCTPKAERKELGTKKSQVKTFDSCSNLLRNSSKSLTGVFNLNSKPLSVFQNFKDFTNNKIKEMLKNS